jgi:hypothetical protein
MSNNFEQRANSGQLFINRQRGDNEKAPRMKGSGCVVIAGVTYDLDIAAWAKESPKAGKWLSLSIKVKTGDEQYERRASPQAPTGQTQVDEEETPW